MGTEKLWNQNFPTNATMPLPPDYYQNQAIIQGLS